MLVVIGHFHCKEHLIGQEIVYAPKYKMSHAILFILFSQRKTVLNISMSCGEILVALVNTLTYVIARSCCQVALREHVFIGGK